MDLPHPRGALGAQVVEALRGVPADDVRLDATPKDRDDALLTLWVLQELHYRGFDDVDDAWEWHPDLLRVRADLERDLEARLRQRLPALRRTGDVVADLLNLVEEHDGPSLARHLQQKGTREQAEELLRQRSVYHLKEADPTSWVVPRLEARPKAALLEVQADEYGNGDPERLHHRLFEQGLAASGLEPAYGHYVGEALPEVLEQNVVASMFGLHRRLRGAALGHLAAFESTSSLPSRQLAQGLDRLGFPPEMVGYYDEHVEADAVHEQLAVRSICGALVRAEPEQAEPVLFGAWTCLDLEARVGAALLERWTATTPARVA